jgi:hypothetical protein
MPATLAEYELQVDEALRSLIRTSRDHVPTPPFQKTLEAYHAKKSAYAYAVELTEALRDFPPDKPEDDLPNWFS